MSNDSLPEGYFLLDWTQTPHDGDEKDGRWGLYCGNAEDSEFLGNLDDHEELVKLAWQHLVKLARQHFRKEDGDDEEKLTKYEELLKKYQEAKDKGEDYVECPRCEGTQTISAVLPENVEMAGMTDMWRYTEDFPCPLCCSYCPDTIDVDKAITWIEDKVDMGE